MKNINNTKKFLLFILLFFILPNYLFAGSIDNLTNIYTYGDVGYMKYIFTALQKAFSSKSYQYLVDVVSFVAVIMIGIRGYKEQSLTAFIKHAALPAALIGLMHYSVTVHIEDQRQVADLTPGTTYYSESDGVPSLLAVMFGSASTLQSLGIKLVDQATKTIQPSEEYSTANLGFANAMGNLVNLTDIALRPGFSDHDQNTTEYMRGLKAYTLQCVLQEAVARKPSDINYLKNPTEDVIDSIEANNLGLTSNDKIQYNGTTSSCEDFWKNNLHNKESNIADILFSKAKEMLNFNLDNAYTGINQVGDVDLNSSVLSSSLGKLKAYILNSATIATFNSAIAQNNDDLTTGVNFANAVTAQASLSNMQLGGVGIAKWFAMVAPYVLHILLGVIYFYGLFVPLMAMVLGWDAGIKYLLSYFSGLLGFAAVGIGMAISNDLVSYFSAKHAVELVASLGGNPATVSGISQYYMDMATYTGVIGFLGVTIATIAPALILKGQSSAAISAIGSFSSMYKGGVDNAESIATDNIGNQKAYEQEQDDIARQKLSKMGISDIPSNMGAAAFYDKIYNSEVQHNKEYGAYDQKSHLAQAAQMAKYSTEQQIGAASQTASMISANGGGQTAFNAGRTQGAMQAGAIEADSLHVSDIKSLNAGSMSQEGRKLGSIIGYGEEANEKQAFNAGKFSGLSMGAEDSRIAGDKNFKGDAITLGHNKADKTMMGAHAFQKAQVYNKDGSNAREHNKYMDGGTELQRKAINEKELAMGLAMAGKTEKERRNMMATIQAASGGKILDDFSHAKGSRKTLGETHDRDGYLESISNKKNITWKDSNGKIHTMSRADANELLGNSGMMGILGKSAAIYDKTNGGKNMDIMANNAMGMEMGNIVGSNKAIEAAGGVEKFASLKGAESAVRTAETKGATINKVAEALKHDDPKLSNEQAQKMAKAIVDGSQEGANKFKEALGALGGLAGTLAGAKTRSDFRSVDAAGGSEDYKEQQARKAAGMVSATKEEMQFLDENYKGGYEGAMHDKGEMSAVSTIGSLGKGNIWTKKTAAELDDIFQKKLADGTYKKADLAQFYKNGDVRKGNIKDHFELAAAFAESSAGNFQGMHGIVIGKNSVGIAVSDGHVRMASIDDSTVRKTGDSTNLNVTSGLQQRAIKYAREQMGKGASEEAVNQRAIAIMKVAEENKSKGNPLDDASIVTAAHQVNQQAKKHGKPNNVQNWIPDDNPLNVVEKGLDKALDVASEYGTPAMATFGINSIFGNPAGKAFKSWKKSRSVKTENSIPNEPSNPRTDQQTQEPSSDSEFHDNSLSKDENIISQSGAKSKYISDGHGGLKLNPEYISETTEGIRKVAKLNKAAEITADAAKTAEWMALADAPEYAIQDKSFRTARAAAAVNQGFDAGVKGILATGEEFIGKTLGVDKFFGTHLSQSASALLQSAGHDVGNAFNNVLHLFNSGNRVYGYEETGQNNSANINFINADGTPPALKVVGGKLVEEISTGTTTNANALASSPHHAVVKTVGGSIPITTNSGKLTIGNYATQVPANDYLTAMKNPQMQQQFAQMMAQSNFNGAYNPMTGIQANSMSALMQNLNKNASIVEQGYNLQQLEQMYGVQNQDNDPFSDVQEIQKRNTIFNMNDQVEDLSDMVYEIRDANEE